MHECLRAKLFSHVRLFETLWTVARQAPLSRGFSRQECWSGLACPPPGDLPDPGLLCLLHRQAGSLPLAPPGKPSFSTRLCNCPCTHLYWDLYFFTWLWVTSNVLSFQFARFTLAFLAGHVTSSIFIWEYLDFSFFFFFCRIIRLVGT